MISSALFKKELRENRWKFWICFIVLGLTAAAIALLYDFINNLLRSIDLSPFIAPSEIDFYFSSYDRYLWSQWTAKNLTQLSTLTAIILAAGAIAGEVTNRTVSFLLSRPLTRLSIYATKSAAGTFYLFCCVIGSTAILILISLLKGFTFDVGGMFVASLLTFSGAVVIYLGSLIFSLLAADPVKAGLFAALFWLAASLPGYFYRTYQLSIFYQMKAVSYWLHGQSPPLPLLVMAAAGALFFSIGAYLWNRYEL
ncbi:MAG: ABC transporter permease subunit [Firmicutes bacterium]|jgi:ABC-type transport system involved in multi-copper enzyme maturation permease subunit|nr:ABC transporter permease subunit [Bacillota bacterium]